MRVYFAYAIDQLSESMREHQESQLTYVLNSIRYHKGLTWIFDPGKAFTVGYSAEPEPGLRAINQLALERADMLIAYLPKGATSVGVPMEIERAASLGKQVVVISDAKAWMLRADLANLHVYDSVSAGVLKAQALISDSLHRQGGQDPQLDQRISLPVATEDNGQLPIRKYPGDAGLDLVVSESIEVPPGEFRDVDCGVRVQLPEWSWGMITGRSSTLRKRGLLVSQGVIDEGYRGPLFAGVFNLTEEPVLVSKGERIAQLIVLDNATRKLQPVLADRLEDSDRGENGFGSTGS